MHDLSNQLVALLPSRLPLPPLLPFLPAASIVNNRVSTVNTLVQSDLAPLPMVYEGFPPPPPAEPADGGLVPAPEELLPQPGDRLSGLSGLSVASPTPEPGQEGPAPEAGAILVGAALGAAAPPAPASDEAGEPPPAPAPPPPDLEPEAQAATDSAIGAIVGGGFPGGRAGTLQCDKR